MSRFYRCLTAATLFGVTAAAQQSAPVGKVAGVIYDSVAMAPLSGAIVQMARADASGVPQTRTATTDSAGRFAFSDVPAGSYGIGFQHAALTALGLEAPLRAFRLAEGASASVDLAIPSGVQVRALTCGGAAADSSEGLLAGYVIDAVRGTPLIGAMVTAHWVELGVVEKKFRAVARDLAMPARDDGSYHICGVTSDAQVEVRVAHPGFRALSTLVEVDGGGTRRFDFRLVDSALTRGTASIIGKVAHSDGSPVASGQVLLVELGIDAPVTDGAFTVRGLPPGTWSLEARVIGYEPQTVVVDAGDGAPATVAITVANKIQVLDAVTVFGEAGGSLKVLNDIVERKRTAFGTSFLPGNTWLKSALYVSDVLQSARGFRYLSSDSVIARGCTESTSIMGTSRRMIFMIDGIRFLGDLSELQNSVQMRDVLAVEAYPDIQSIPAQWRSNDACALVAVWTKR